MADARAESPVQKRIVRAARDLFVEKGFVETRTREIARAAETSESGLLRHFESKQALFKAAYNDAWADANRFVDDTVGTSKYDDPRVEVAAIVRAFWMFYAQEPRTSAFLVLATESADSLVDEEDAFYIQRIERLCNSAEAAGLLGPIPARVMAEGIFGLLEGIVLGWHFTDHLKDSRYPRKISIDEAMLLVHKLLF